jgi:glucokinase
MSPEPVIGVDAGGTKLLAGTLAGDAEVHHRVYRLWDGGDRDGVIATMVEAVAAVKSAAGGADAVGFGIPSLVDQSTGASVSSVHLPLDDLPFRALMEERLGLPVYVDNDVNLAALAEVRVGAARGARVAVMLTLGTGIGGAIVIDGRLFRGADGAAGEFGHVTVDVDGPMCACGNRGCLEAVVSGPALGRAGAHLGAADPAEPMTGARVTDLALAGDEDARAAVESVGELLGVGLVGIVNTFNPEVVVIGGGVARAGELLLEPARRVVASRALRPSRDRAQIVPAALGDEAGLIGAALFARLEGAA